MSQDLRRDESGGMNVRVAAVVLNSVSHDARVIKEAESLARAGYEVAIFGIRDNREADPTTELPSGVVIHRADWKSRAYADAARLIRIAGVLAVAGAVGLYVCVFAFGSQILAVLTSWSFIFVLGLLPLLALMIPFRRKADEFANVARRLEGRPVRSRAAAPGRAGGMRTAWRRPVSALRGRAVRVLDVARRRVFRRTQEQAILRLVEGWRPRIVHCHDLHTVPIGLRMKQRHGTRLVYDSHELYEDQSMISPHAARAARRRQRAIARRVDGFITVNDSIARTLHDRYAGLPEPVVVKNATEPQAEPVEDDGRLRAAANLPADGRILLYQGGFSPRRGLDVLVRSAPLLPEGWTLVMMGWGAFEPKLRAIAESVDPDGHRVRFVPPAPRTELAAWTAGADLGVIPYENVCLNHWYCSPNKLWEYPIAGVPVLASPFPELRGPIEQWSIGRLIDDPPTPEGIAAAVADVTPAALAEMSAQCRRFIESDNWSVYERRLVELYERLRATRRSRPASSAAAKTALDELPKVAAGP
jgi:glycosyltransferase involved in cell wall biosynthesis